MSTEIGRGIEKSRGPDETDTDTDKVSIDPGTSAQTELNKLNKENLKDALKDANNDIKANKARIKSMEEAKEKEKAEKAEQAKQAKQDMKKEAMKKEAIAKSIEEAKLNKARVFFFVATFFLLIGGTIASGFLLHHFDKFKINFKRK